MEDTEIADVAEKIAKQILPVIKELLDREVREGIVDDELSISDIKEQYPQVSPYLVRKWCSQGILDYWTVSGGTNSKYLFRRDDFESIYYEYFKKRESQT